MANYWHSLTHLQVDSPREHTYFKKKKATGLLKFSLVQIILMFNKYELLKILHFCFLHKGLLSQKSCLVCINMELLHIPWSFCHIFLATPGLVNFYIFVLTCAWHPFCTQLLHSCWGTCVLAAILNNYYSLMSTCVGSHLEVIYLHYFCFSTIHGLMWVCLWPYKTLEL